MFQFKCLHSQFIRDPNISMRQRNLLTFCTGLPIHRKPLTINVMKSRLELYFNEKLRFLLVPNSFAELIRFKMRHLCAFPVKYRKHAYRSFIGCYKQISSRSPRSCCLFDLMIALRTFIHIFTSYLICGKWDVRDQRIKEVYMKRVSSRNETFQCLDSYKKRFARQM